MERECLIGNPTVENCPPLKIGGVAGEGCEMTKLTDKKRERSERKKRVFVDALSKCPNVSLACKRAGMSRETAYQWKKIDDQFSRSWDDAIEIAVDSLEQEAIRRAKRNSDVLMIFLLKAHRPKKYRERFFYDLKNDPELKATVKAFAEVLREYVPREHFLSAINRFGVLAAGAGCPIVP